MPKPLAITVRESVPELRLLQKKHPSKYRPLQMLVLLQQQGPLSKDRLASLLGASDKTIHIWRNKYINAGVEALLQDGRGGNRPGVITEEVHQKLSCRLNDPKGGFRSFEQMRQWLEDSFGLDASYQAVYKYVQRHFNARPKVSRKSHVLKSPADEAVFKKPVRKI